MLLELAGEEAFPLGHLLIPGFQYSLSLPGLQGQGVRVGLVNVGPHPLQAVGVLQLPTHHAHQQLVERIIVHEVAVPPHGLRDRTFLTVIVLIVSEQKLWLIWRVKRKSCGNFTILICILLVFEWVILYLLMVLCNLCMERMPPQCLLNCCERENSYSHYYRTSNQQQQRQKGAKQVSYLIRCSDSSEEFTHWLESYRD